MKRTWLTEELVEQWSLRAGEKTLVLAKRGEPSRLGFAVLLKFFQHEGRFPERPQAVPQAIVEHLAQELGISPQSWSNYAWDSRTITYHRTEIRRILGFREATVEDGETLVAWLCQGILSYTHHPDHIQSAVYQWFQQSGIEPPSLERLDRLIKSAIHNFEVGFCNSILARISSTTCERLEAMIRPVQSEISDNKPQETLSDASRTGLHELRRDTGGATLENLLNEIARLNQVRELKLPADLFVGCAPKVLQNYRRRVAVEEPYELRRHPQALRVTLLAIFCHLRTQELTDILVDLLIEIIHRIGARAERRVEKRLIENLKQVSGKTGLLFRLAEATLEHPDEVVRDVVFPVVSEQTLQELVKEWKTAGPQYRQQVQTVIVSAYRSHYRRMMPQLLNTLEFRSNNEIHRPIIQALELLKKYVESKIRTYPSEENIPLDGVVRRPWREAVIERDKKDQVKINRISYELCALQTLREKLRCKEIWVVGADHYRNPDDDLPADFDQQKTTYYAALRLPLDAATFIQNVKAKMLQELTDLNCDLPNNPDVQMLPKAGGWIKLSPLDPQSEPTHLLALKAEIAKRWSMISLLDILKETDLRVGFTEVFCSPTAWEKLDRKTLQYRLLLCLYALGTNTGLKRVSAGYDGVSYKDLLYTRRRFITKDFLREAIRIVINKTFQIRLPQIWGEGTTACASDSKKFSAWDQNLMTEWHVRYGGAGIMIYWHVERKAACIYSQLKTCSSSEVASMIEGVLHHCTEMSVDRQYVDSHGQSEVAFAFCRLLGFQLLPRLKGIHRKKLYRPEAGKSEEFPHLQPVLSRPINWELIAQQYDQMVKYATALRMGTAEAESILRRFTRNNLQHPTYKAFSELGKAECTTFLCRYLRLPPLRREVHEGLNVVENWNSANQFILFGKGGEIATNRREEQELIMLALHLLQSSLVYINTLMIQRVLTEPAWKNHMAVEDLRAITPLFYNHINPYGTFHLDMKTRLDID